MGEKAEITQEYLKLIRLNTLIVDPITLLGGAILASGLKLSWLYIYLLIAGIIIHIQIYGWNDYWDASYDKTKNYLKDKPLISGKLNMTDVRHFLLIAFIPLLLIAFLIDYGYLLFMPLATGLIYDKLSKRTPYATIAFGLYASTLLVAGAIIAGGALTKIILLSSVYLGLVASSTISIGGALKDKDDLYATIGLKKLNYVGLAMRIVGILLLIRLLILVGITTTMLMTFIVCTVTLFVSYAGMFIAFSRGDRLQLQGWRIIGDVIGLAMLPIILSPIITWEFAIFAVTTPIILFMVANKLLVRSKLPIT